MATAEISFDIMPTTQRAGLASLGMAVGIGAVAGLLVPTGAWGLGFLLTIIALFVTSLLLRKNEARPSNSKADLLWIGVLLFSLCIAWRDAPEMRFLNIVMVALLMGIMAIKGRGGKISDGTVYDYPFRALGSWAVAWVDAINLVATDISWRLIPKDSKGRKVGAAMRGLLLAAPLILIFGALFANADAGFEGMVKNAFRFDFETIVQQTFVGGSFAWIAAGLFRRRFVATEPPPLPPNPNTQPVEPPRLGSMEVGIVMGSLNLLFLLFVSTQAHYFFGGLSVVRSTAGLGVAEFARRGFFELVAVTGLTLPTLLGLHALADPSSRSIQRLYKIMAGVLIGLLCVVMISAGMKMMLYLQSFGLSTLRIYVAATLAWLVLVFAWFIVTVLNGRERRFAWGGVVSMALVVFGLNVMSPDRTVAEWNLSHQSVDKIDWGYLGRLSADATPSIVNHWAKIPAAVKPRVAEGLSSTLSSIGDWRSSNLSQLVGERSAAGIRKEVESLVPAATPDEPQGYVPEEVEVLTRER